MKLAGIQNMNGYIRKTFIHSYTIHLQISELAKCAKLLCYTSNNINQIARWINPGGEIYPKEMDEISIKLTEVSRLYGNTLWVNYKDHSYEYTDYRVDSDLRFSGKGGKITENELRTALEKLGIAIPDAARFVAVDEEKGEYAFRAECVIEDGVLTDGELSCWVVEGSILYRVKNTLSVSTLQGDAAVISPQEAYERLCAGRFSWRDVPMFDYLSPYQVRVNACELEYLTDSKGFRQPVYTFTLSDDNDAELRSRNGWTTFVPALAGS